MIRALLAALAFSMCAHPVAALDDGPSVEERQIIDRAYRCPNSRNPDPFYLWRLLEHEERAGIPGDLRGLVLAAACHESGFSPRALGDCYGTKKCRARGVLQLWRWWERRYNVNRSDPDQSAEAWLYHVVRQVPKARRICNAKGRRLWRIAQVRAVRSGGRSRCG